MQWFGVGTLGEELPAVGPLELVKRRRRGPLEGQRRSGALQEQVGEPLDILLDLVLCGRDLWLNSPEAHEGDAVAISYGLISRYRSRYTSERCWIR